MKKKNLLEENKGLVERLIHLWERHGNGGK
jgi:hypothetical protein